jgi:hypothetical protein
LISKDKKNSVSAILEGNCMNGMKSYQFQLLSGSEREKNKSRRQLSDGNGCIQMLHYKCSVDKKNENI